MEECLEYLKIIYPSLDFFSLFDHLCGRGQSHKVRLKASITRKYFDGKQPNMRDTVILEEDRFLGPYDHILATDNTQHMWWDPDLPYIQIPRPFWISYMENAEHHYDGFTGKTKHHKLDKNELIDRLHSSGVTSKGLKDDIVIKAKENDKAVKGNDHEKKEGCIQLDISGVLFLLITFLISGYFYPLITLIIRVQPVSVLFPVM